jgi:Phosphopantetheine attachment site
VVTSSADLQIRLIRQPERLAFADVEQFAADLIAILRRIARQPLATIGDLRAVLSVDLRGKASALEERSLPATQLPFASPASDMEQVVAQVWADLFGTELISLDDNFFELGGHSLLLLRAHAQLRARLGTDLPVVVLLQYPTIRSLARHLGAGSAQGSSTRDTAVERARKQRESQARQRDFGARR